VGLEWGGLRRLLLLLLLCMLVVPHTQPWQGLPDGTCCQVLLLRLPPPPLLINQATLLGLITLLLPQLLLGLQQQATCSISCWLGLLTAWLLVGVVSGGGLVARRQLGGEGPGWSRLELRLWVIEQLLKQGSPHGLGSRALLSPDDAEVLPQLLASLQAALEPAMLQQLRCCGFLAIGLLEEIVQEVGAVDVELARGDCIVQVAPPVELEVRFAKCPLEVQL